MFLLVIFIILKMLNLSISYNGELISKYFELRDVHAIHIFVCDKKEGTDIRRYFKHKGRYLIKTGLPHQLNIQYLAPKHYNVGIFINLKCESNKMFINNRTLLFNKFNTTYKWLAWGTEEHDVFKSIENIDLGFDSDFVIAFSNGTLFDVFKLKSNSTAMEVYKAGAWPRPKIKLKKIKRNNLKGTIIKGVYVLIDLVVPKNNLSAYLLEHTYHPQLDVFHRQHYEIHEGLKKLYNYKIDYVFSSTWGMQTDKGEWIGMVVDIGNGLGEIGASPCHPLEGRAHFVFFLPSLQNLRIIFMFRQPKVLGSCGALLYPLTTNAWISLFVIIFIFIICYEGIAFVCSAYRRQKELEKGNGFVFVIATLSQQGLTFEPYRLSIRILSTFLLLFGMVMFVYYNAYIMKVLLQPAPNKIQNMDQLMDSSLEPRLMDIQYLRNRINFDAYFSLKAKHKLINLPYIGLNEGVKLVKEKPYAFSTSDDLMYYEIARTFSDSDICQLFEMEICRPLPLSFPVAKHSHYREFLTQGVLWVQENGLSYKVKKDWYPPFPPCLGSIQFMHVSLGSVSVALTVLAIGMIVSLFIFGLEFKLAKKHKMSKLIIRY